MQGAVQCHAIYKVCYAMHQSMWKVFGDAWRSMEFSTQGCTLTDTTPHLLGETALLTPTCEAPEQNATISLDPSALKRLFSEVINKEIIPQLSDVLEHKLTTLLPPGKWSNAGVTSQKDTSSGKGKGQALPQLSLIYLLFIRMLMLYIG